MREVSRKKTVLHALFRMTKITLLILSIINYSIFTLNYYIFEGGAPTALTLNVYGTECVLLSPDFIKDNADFIAVVKSFIGVVVLYKWLLGMRKKVTAV